MLSHLSGSELIVLLVSLVISITLHEAMHGYVAHWLGDSTAEEHGRLTLNPLKSIDLLTTIILPMIMISLGLFPILAAKPVPINFMRLKFEEYGLALVGLAGPLTNLLLAVIMAMLMRLLSGSVSITVLRDMLVFVEINVALFVFNMIPIPPLDGSRVLYAFAPEGFRKILNQIESLGFIFLLLVFVLLIQTPALSGALGNIETTIITFLVG